MLLIIPSYTFFKNKNKNILCVTCSLYNTNFNGILSVTQYYSLYFVVTIYIKITYTYVITLTT